MNNKIKFEDISTAFLQSILDHEGLEDYAPAEAYVLLYIREALSRADSDVVELNRSDMQETLDYCSQTITRAVKGLERRGRINVRRRFLRNEYRLA